MMDVKAENNFLRMTSNFLDRDLALQSKFILTVENVSNIVI